MTSFRSKTLESSRTLGDRLRSHREKLGLTLEEAAKTTAVSVKYLAAIEESAYARLPGDVYVRNFLRAYARFLRLASEDVLDQYDREHGVVRSFVHQGPRFVPRHVDAKPFFTPRRLRAIGLSVVAFAVLAYLAWQVWSIVRPPDLLVDSPTPRLTTTDRSVSVRGTTDPESEVTINGQRVLVDVDGRFSETVDLHLGLNTIQIVAARKRSRPATVVRQVLAQDSIQN